MHVKNIKLLECGNWITLKEKTLKLSDGELCVHGKGEILLATKEYVVFLW